MEITKKFSLSMNVAVTGATGLLGRRLCAELVRAGHRLTALSRDAGRARRVLPAGVECVTWNIGTAGPWEDAVAAADAVVHLAGEPVAARRWTPARKAVLRASRVDSTAALVRVMARRGGGGRALVCASAVGYYGDRGDELLTEQSPPGGDFLARLCVEWEAAANEAAAAGVRVATMRIGIVLAPEGGPLREMLYPLGLPVSPWKLGLGGRLGSGRQWVPWVHADDAVNLLLRAATDDTFRGPVNVTAPNPVRNADFTRALGRALGRPAVLPVPGAVLRLVVGEMAGVLLTGQRTVPGVATTLEYAFQFPELGGAIGSILAR